MEWDFIIRLCVAGLCGTVIGLDREYRVKDAGFRTHFLVALGSALIMIVSQYGFADILMHTGVGPRALPRTVSLAELHAGDSCKQSAVCPRRGHCTWSSGNRKNDHLSGSHL